MPIRSNDHAQAIEDQGFKLLYNPLGGGNCQFAELLHQAKRMERNHKKRNSRALKK